MSARMQVLKLRPQTEDIVKERSSLQGLLQVSLANLNNISSVLSCPLFKEPQPPATPVGAANVGNSNEPALSGKVQTQNSGTSGVTKTTDSGHKIALKANVQNSTQNRDLKSMVINRPNSSKNRKRPLTQAGSSINKCKPIMDADGFVQPSRRHTIKARDATSASEQSNSQLGPTSSVDGASCEENNFASLSDQELGSEEEMENIDSTPVVPPPKKPKVPFIYILPDEHWRQAVSMASALCPSFHSELKGRFLRVKLESESEYRALVHFLCQHDIKYKSYNLKEERPIKVVVRGLPMQTPPSDVAAQVEIAGFKVLKAVRLTRRNKAKTPLPLFYLQVSPSPHIEELYNITELFLTSVKIEPYRGRKGPSMCYRCQGYFHSSEVCNLPLRCVRCAGPHAAKDCPLGPDDCLRCANCNGEHAANWRGCPKFPGLKTNARKNKNENNQVRRENAQRQPSTNQITRPQVPYAKVQPNLPFSSVVSGQQMAAPVSEPNTDPIPNSGPSMEETLNAVAFLAEKFGYSMFNLTRALKKALPQLRAAKHGCDAAFLILESYNELSSA